MGLGNVLWQKSEEGMRKLLKTQGMRNALFGPSVEVCEPKKAGRRASRDEIMKEGGAECYLSQ